MNNLHLFFLFIAIGALAACGKKTSKTDAADQKDCTSLSDSDKKEIVDSLTFRMNKYAEALNLRNPEMILCNYSKDGNFRLFADGVVHTYADMEKIGQGLTNFKSVNVTWDTVVITPLTSQSALATAPFHRVIVGPSGTETRDWGTANWAWVKKNGRWFMAYGHSNHYSDLGKGMENRSIAETGSDAEQIKNLMKKIEAEWKRGNIAAVTGCMDDDFLNMPPGKPVNKGKTLVTKLYNELMAGNQNQWTIDSFDDVLVSGNLGVARVSTTEVNKPKSGSETTTLKAKSIFVLRKNNQGEWKEIIEIWNANQ